VLYWLIASLLLPLGYAAMFAQTVVTHSRRHERTRASELAAVQQYLAGPRRRFETYYERQIRLAGGPQAWIDARYPPTHSFRYVAFVFNAYYEPHARQQAQVTVALLAWPWLTLATLMIFRVSMSRAKVNGVHVLRCTLYCCDGTAWLGVLAFWLVPWLFHSMDLGRHTAYQHLAIAAPLFALVTGWRLSAAYRYYLRFDHPSATAAASQVVVTLAVWVLLFVRLL
jgi:hypothetical protein